MLFRSAIMSQASNPLWYNSRGEYIGYSKVIECNEDKNGKLIDGYTVHTFSNFGPGYMDEDRIPEETPPFVVGVNSFV